MLYTLCHACCCVVSLIAYHGVFNTYWAEGRPHAFEEVHFQSVCPPLIIVATLIMILVPISALLSLAGLFRKKQGLLRLSTFLCFVTAACGVVDTVWGEFLPNLAIHLFWTGIPHVLPNIPHDFDNGFPALCHAAQECDHLCLYSPEQVLVPAAQAAAALLLGAAYEVDVPAPPNGGVCVSNEQFDMMENFASPHKAGYIKTLQTLFAAVVALQFAAVCFGVLASREASAREVSAKEKEGTVVEPLLA